MLEKVMINGIPLLKGLSLTDFTAQYGTETQCEASPMFCMPTLRPSSCVRIPAQQKQGLPVLGVSTSNQLAHLAADHLSDHAIQDQYRRTGLAAAVGHQLTHKIMEAMRQREANCPLRGEIRVDGAYLGEVRKTKWHS